MDGVVVSVFNYGYFNYFILDGDYFRAVFNMGSYMKIKKLQQLPYNAREQAFKRLKIMGFIMGWKTWPGTWRYSWKELIFGGINEKD